MQPMTSQCFRDLEGLQEQLFGFTSPLVDVGRNVNKKVNARVNPSTPKPVTLTTIAILLRTSMSQPTVEKIIKS
jgi:hypothetical protein